MLKDGVLEYSGDRFILSPGVIQIGIHGYKARSGFLTMLKLASCVLMEEFFVNVCSNFKQPTLLLWVWSDIF